MRLADERNVAVITTLAAAVGILLLGCLVYANKAHAQPHDRLKATIIQRATGSTFIARNKQGGLRRLGGLTYACASAQKAF